GGAVADRILGARLGVGIEVFRLAVRSNDGCRPPVSMASWALDPQRDAGRRGGVATPARSDGDPVPRMERGRVLARHGGLAARKPARLSHLRIRPGGGAPVDQRGLVTVRRVSLRSGAGGD